MPFIDISNSVILPVSKGDFHSDWDDCLKQLKTQKKDNRFRIFKMNIFVHSDNKTDFVTRKEFINDSLLNIFGNECPTFGIIPALPEQQINTAIELGRVTAPGVIIKFRKLANTGYIILEKDGYKEFCNVFNATFSRPF